MLSNHPADPADRRRQRRIIMHLMALGAFCQLYQAYCEAERHEVLMHLLALGAF